MDKLWTLLTALLVQFAVLAAPAIAANPSALATAKQLLNAFNQHDPGAMAELVSEDFELYYFSNGKAELSAQGRQQLQEQMVDYFASQPTVRSEIEGSIDGPRFASFRERAISVHDGVERSASSLAIYEVVDGLIRRVWYYPAEAPRELAVASEQGD